MGIFDEFKRLAHPYEDEDEDDFDDFDISPRPVERRERPERVPRSESYPSSMEDDRRSNKVVNIADHLREKRTVVLNLESTNKEIARRILDFLSGAAYSQEGKVKKVAISTYIITPYNVDILGDLIDELENNGLYF